MFLRYAIMSCLLFMLLPWVSSVEATKPQYYRNYWSPMYQGARLNYCMLDAKTCGQAVADDYCRMMGYQSANEALKANNVGVTHFLASHAKCQGWQCDGFKLIRCVGKIKHQPMQGYYYRYRRFVYPRFGHYRVAWCYADHKHCGEKAAYSFCRRMGYMGSKRYTQQQGVQATKSLGDQKLCFGSDCTGFHEIICYR